MLYKWKTIKLRHMEFWEYKNTKVFFHLIYCKITWNFLFVCLSLYVVKGLAINQLTGFYHIIFINPLLCFIFFYIANTQDIGTSQKNVFL